MWFGVNLFHNNESTGGDPYARGRLPVEGSRLAMDDLAVAFYADLR